MLPPTRCKSTVGGGAGRAPMWGSPPELRPASSSSKSTRRVAVTQAMRSFESNSRPHSRSYLKFGPAPVARISISNAEAPHYPAPIFSPASV